MEHAPNPLSQALNKLAEAMNIPLVTQEVGTVSEEESEELRKARFADDNKPQHYKSRTISERHPGIIGFSRRVQNPKDD